MAKEILIADSDKMVQEEFERIFEATDHHLLFTTSDEEALIRGRLFKPDLIIGGKDLCQEVRADQELKNIPFIILLDMFEDLSEKERKFLRADGMISRPLNEDEILSMVSHLSEEVQEGAGETVISEDDLKWKSFADIGKAETEKREEFSLDGLGGIEEEIIELVDVVEEPESRMSIDDFALQQKDELIGEIAPIESWEKQGREEVSFEKEFVLPTEEIRMEPEETSLQIEEEKEIVDKKVSTEDELFEKIELEEILRKVERLQPSIEKEWPVEKEEKIPEKIMPEKIAPPPQEAGDRYTGFDEFEAALRGEVKTEPAEEAFQPFFIKETTQEAPGLATPEEAPAELELQELAEGEFPEVFLEELVEELEKLKEEELMPEETAVATEAETTLEEEISELLGEEIQPWGQALEEVARGEELPPVDELVLMEVIAPVEELKEAGFGASEVTEIPKISLEEISPPVMRLDRKIEEVIAKGIQEMMQDFVNKVIPEMAKHMITVTMERIETMVKEVIPDLAEKAIQEEIRRLQKGEKD
jgi:CheY-like chemotaxis protein